MFGIVTSQQNGKQSCEARSPAAISVLIGCHDRIQAALWRVALVMHCHQLPERSFSPRNRQVPLCTRCLGLLVGALLIPCYVRDLRIASLLIAAMILDGGTQE